MRTSTILSMCVALAMTAFTVGCATAAKGPSDEALIQETLAGWKAGMETKDAGKLGTVVSEEFTHYEWGDKKQLLAFLSTTFANGDLDGAKINLATAKTTIEGSSATVYPVALEAAFGTATIEFKLKKESDGVWRAVGINVEGI